MSPQINFLLDKRCELYRDGRDYDVTSAAESWLWPTYFALKDKHRCELTQRTDVPGILVASAYSIRDLRIPVGVFLVAIIADGFPDNRADVTIIQNLLQGPFCRRPLYMHHWPQPNLIPRSSGRRGRLEKAYYFGHEDNLSADCKGRGFAARLESEAGVEFVIPPPSQWSDYTDADLVIASRNRRGPWHGCKPATKLFNAWRAGTVLVGGSESSFLQQGAADRNFLWASNAEQIVAQVRQMRKDRESYEGIRSNAIAEAVRHTWEARASQWVAAFEEVVFPHYSRWHGSGGRRRGERMRHDGRFLGYKLLRKYGNRIPIIPEWGRGGLATRLEQRRAWD